MTDDAKEFTMRRDLKIMILNAFLVGALGGYAVTRWGTAGAFGGVALALVLGVVHRNWKR